MNMQENLRRKVESIPLEYEMINFLQCMYGYRDFLRPHRLALIQSDVTS
jgi:hypothetical protein